MREATYEIRVRGRISSAALERLEGMQGGPGSVETDQDILPRQDFLRSDYYNGFM